MTGLFGRIFGTVLRPKLVFRRHPPEVAGEEVYVCASDSGVTFWVKREPQETSWTWIVTDAGDGGPLDVGVEPTRDAAVEACERWFQDGD